MQSYFRYQREGSSTVILGPFDHTQGKLRRKICLIQASKSQKRLIAKSRFFVAKLLRMTLRMERIAGTTRFLDGAVGRRYRSIAMYPMLRSQKLSYRRKATSRNRCPPI